MRHTTGYYLDRFSRLSGLTVSSIYGLERGKILHPTLTTIRKIRLMERVFAVELEQYRANPEEYDRLAILASKRKVITKPDGTTRTIYKFGGYWNPKHRPIDLTSRPHDLAALGGMSAWVGDPAAPTRKNVYARIYATKNNCTIEEATIRLADIKKRKSEWIQRVTDRSKIIKVMRHARREARLANAAKPSPPNPDQTVDDWGEYENGAAVESGLSIDG